MDDEVAVRINRRHYLWVAILSLAFIAVGVSIVSHGNPVGIVIGASAVAFCGLCFLVFLAVLVRSPPLLTIGNSGLRIGALTRRGTRHIPWEEIAGLRIFRFEAAPLAPGRRTLGIVPVNPNSPVWAKIRLQRLNARVAGVPATIFDRSVDLELEEIAQIMRRFKPHLLVEYGEPRAMGLGRLGRPRNRPR